jgi:hypothetical protein
MIKRQPRTANTVTAATTVTIGDWLVVGVALGDMLTAWLTESRLRGVPACAGAGAVAGALLGLALGAAYVPILVSTDGKIFPLSSAKLPDWM